MRPPNFLSFFLVLLSFDYLLAVDDIDAGSKSVPVVSLGYLYALQGVDACWAAVVGRWLVYAGGSTDGTEVEVGRVFILGWTVVVQIESGADVLQREALAIDILDVPDGAVLDVFAVLVVQAQDEAAPACGGLTIQVAWLAKYFIR